MFESGEIAFHRVMRKSIYIGFFLSPGYYCSAMTITCSIEDKCNSSEPERPFQCCLQMQSARRNECVEDCAICKSFIATEDPSSIEAVMTQSSRRRMR